MTTCRWTYVHTLLTEDFIQSHQQEDEEWHPFISLRVAGGLFLVLDRKINDTLITLNISIAVNQWTGRSRPLCPVYKVVVLFTVFVLEPVGVQSEYRLPAAVLVMFSMFDVLVKSERATSVGFNSTEYSHNQYKYTASTVFPLHSLTAV